MSFRYSPSVVTNGLVLYLDAANTRSYPGTGTVWSDLSRSGNNGTLINGPTFNSGNGGSIVFDGSNDYCPTNNIFNNSAATWAAWFNPSIITPDGVYGRRIIHQSDGGGSKEINIYHSSGNLGWYGYGSSYVWNLTTTGISTNTWYYVTGTYNGSTAVLYLNGQQKNSTTQTGTVGAATVNLSIARVGFTAVGHFAGNIANIQIYNRALSATEILQNYNATKSRFGL